MRRGKPQERPILPDLRHNSVVLSTFVQHMMIKGKKSLALRLMYDALDMIQEKTGKPGIETFDAAIKNVAPVMEVRPRRVGGATFQVPTEIRADRKIALTIKWLISYSRGRNEKSMAMKLAGEIIAAAKEEGAAHKKKEDTHRMAEANKAFSHFRF